MPYGSAFFHRPASLEILIPSRSHLCLCCSHCAHATSTLECCTISGPPPLTWSVFNGCCSGFALPGTNVLSHRASSAWCPASCGSLHQAHWSPFQGSFLSLTVEGISLFPGGWITRSCLGSLTHAGLTAASIFPWENIHQLLLSLPDSSHGAGLCQSSFHVGLKGPPRKSQ